MDSILTVQLINLPKPFIPLLIFFARIFDVSIGTIRIIVVGRGMRAIASLLGFFEIMIWLLAISQVLSNLAGLENYLAYAAGFAAGTFVGMTIERRFALGHSIIRIIVPEESASLADRLIEHGHRITRLEARGAKGPVEIIFSIIKSKTLKSVLDIVKKFKPDAFYSVEDVRSAKEFDHSKHTLFEHRRLLQPFFWFRKSK
jgi:uncharacterized protein YebE (UPF0316 family)